MNLKKQIAEDMKAAMKAGDTVGRDTLRMLDSMIKNEEITAGSREEGLGDDGVIALVKRAIKQRKDASAQYKEAGRSDLSEGEDAEIAVIEKYLPEQMSQEAVEEIVQGVIAESGATGPSDMGKVMGLAMKAVGDAADGGAVKSAVDACLKKL